MQIAVFGSTGEASRLTLREGLARGHVVVAYARSPRRLEALAHDRLLVVEGELSDRAAIGRAADGADAVVSLLGSTGRRGGDHPIKAGTLHVVDAMREHGVRRLVATATPSYRVAEDGESLPFRLAVEVVKRLIPDVYADVVGTDRGSRGRERDRLDDRPPPDAHEQAAEASSERRARRRPRRPSVLSVAVVARVVPCLGRRGRGVRP